MIYLIYLSSKRTDNRWDNRQKPYWMREPKYYPPVPPAASTVFKPSVPYDSNDIGKYLLDVDSTLPHIFVEAEAILPGTRRTVDAKATYKVEADERFKIRVVRSGTGFRVFGHPDIPEGAWLSCR